jgi:hypothetical protein
MVGGKCTMRAEKSAIISIAAKAALLKDADICMCALNVKGHIRY